MKKTLAILLFSLVSTAANAQTKDEARTQFERGIELFEDKKFDQAAIAFERAYELKPSFKLLYNIGQTKNELGHYAGALEAYRRYLEEGGADVPEDRAASVKEEIARLETLVGGLMVEGHVDGATVYVDQRDMGTMPLNEAIVVDLGDHTVSVKMGTQEIHTEVVEVAGGAQVVVIVPKEPLTARETEPVAPKKRRWTWGAMGIGAGALVTGSIIGAVSVSKRKDIESQCTNQICSSSLTEDKKQVENLSIAADVLFAVGAAGIATGVVLFFVEPKWSRESLAPVSIGPLSGPASLGRGVNLIFARSF